MAHWKDNLHSINAYSTVKMLYLITILACTLPFTVAVPSGERAALVPTVELPQATIVGSSLFNVDSFKGIPYAQPPTGELRLKPPQPITSSLGTVVAVGVPQACPQFFAQINSDNLPSDVIAAIGNTPLGQAITNAGEDCLTLNIQRPSTATDASKLPVVFWIFGGGFELGSTQTYDATELIATSVSQGKDILYVAVNYRLGGFGFLPGKEILADGSSNLGLLDQRLALQWVADNIEQFGGDPDKVTIWGESAGSISVFDQMALLNGNNTYKGKPLFRAAVMDSGSIVPADPVDCPKGQTVYDTVVSNAGCSGANDTLACLRVADYTTFLNAANSVPSISGYNSIALSYVPRPDGALLTKSPELLALSGQYARVPFIIGDQEDEGTIFALQQFDLITTSDLVNYLRTIFFHDASVTQMESLVATYPDDPAAGAPFGTGLLYSIYPQFKRLAAMLGDLSFTLSRRALLSIVNDISPTVPIWSYLASYGDALPFVGTFHGSDILVAYGILPGIPCSSIQSYYISFFNTMNPNDGTELMPTWPQWSQGNQLMNFGLLGNSLIPDTFRNESYNFIAANTAFLHI